MRKLLCALGVCVAGAVQAAPAYSTLNWSGFTSTTAAGTVSDSRGNILATLSVHNGGATLLNILGSAYFGTFYGGRSAADVYEPNLSGVRDVLSIASQSDATVYTLSFSREVESAVFHAYGADLRTHGVQGGATATVLVGPNLAAASGPMSDGKRLGIAIASSGAATEPGSLALAGLGLVLAGTAGRRAYRPRLKPTDSALGLRMSSSRGEGRVTLAS